MNVKKRIKGHSYWDSYCLRALPETRGKPSTTVTWGFDIHVIIPVRNIIITVIDCDSTAGL